MVILYYIAKIRGVSIKRKYKRPLLISVTGAHSGAGKTSLACLILENLKGSWGAIKYTKTAVLSSVSDAVETLHLENKDTSRLVRAGALKVLWIQSPSGQQLTELLSRAMAELNYMDGILVEGNSPSRLMEFDVRFFVFGYKSAAIKAGAEDLLEKSSVAVFNGKYSDTQMKEVLRPYSVQKYCCISLYNVNVKDGSSEEGRKILFDAIKLRESALKMQ